jgi:hypothetical protein
MTQIISEYKQNKTMNKDKMTAYVEVMNHHHYYGVKGIGYFLNIQLF